MKRPQLHLTPAINWLNDPVGFIFYKGEYHLFYQHFPFALRWGTMHWGHAVSSDLVHWRQKPVALFPTQEGDRNGCFSGSAVEQDDRLRLYYTGVRYNSTSPVDIHTPLNDDFTACQMCLVSEDGETFDNFQNKSVVLPVLDDKTLGDAKDTRDPKVWREGEALYMALGSRCRLRESGENAPELLLYRSHNGEDWKLWSRLVCPGFGYMWECPDLFRIENRWVYCFSPMGAGSPGEQPHIAMCGFADCNLEKGLLNMERETFRLADCGLDYYAPQSTLDNEGRRVQVGWLRGPRPLPGEDWFGMISLPRVVSVRGEKICFDVHPNISGLFQKEISLSQASMDQPLCLKAELCPGAVLDLGGLTLRVEEDVLLVDRSHVFPSGGPYKPVLEAGFEGVACGVEIYIDYGVVEIFINRGESVLSTLVYQPYNAVSAQNCTQLSCFALETN